VRGDSESGAEHGRAGDEVDVVACPSPDFEIDASGTIDLATTYGGSKIDVRIVIKPTPQFAQHNPTMSIMLSMLTPASDRGEVIIHGTGTVDHPLVRPER
jgi:hypothetical protein